MTLSDIKVFIKHLRLNYQLFVLSSLYLAGGLFSVKTNLLMFIVQFFSVHILLFGGVTAYNSYWDKDTGPIGGLKNPQKMKRWMLYASWIIQFLGLVIGIFSGVYFVLCYIGVMILFWLYSGPHTRLKEKPILAFVVTFLSVGIFFYMGYIAFGSNSITLVSFLASLGSALVLISMYPFSQSYQYHDDKARGQNTIVVKYGIKGVKRIFIVCFLLSIISFFFALYSLNLILAISYVVTNLIVYFILLNIIKNLNLTRKDYNLVMKTKYSLSLVFIICILGLFFIIH
jgi:4-hydroxybenzoate polyprenyltransferase